MNEYELRDRILMREYLERQESAPAGTYDPCSGMNENDLNKDWLSGIDSLLFFIYPTKKIAGTA